MRIRKNKGKIACIRTLINVFSIDLCRMCLCGYYIILSSANLFIHILYNDFLIGFESHRNCRFYT